MKLFQCWTNIMMPPKVTGRLLPLAGVPREESVVTQSGLLLK